MCGECGRAPDTVMQEMKSSVSYQLDKDGYVIEGSEWQSSSYCPTGKLVALCICGHSWRLKRKREITELKRKEPKC